MLLHRARLQAPENDIERYKHLGVKRATYLAMITVIDQGLGRILEALDRKEIAENTLVVFFSDNGGPTKHPQLVRKILEKLVAFRKLRPEGGVPPMLEPEPKGWKPFPKWEPVE